MENENQNVYSRSADGWRRQEACKGRDAEGFSNHVSTASRNSNHDTMLRGPDLRFPVHSASAISSTDPRLLLKRPSLGGISLDSLTLLICTNIHTDILSFKDIFDIS